MKWIDCASRDLEHLLVWTRYQNITVTPPNLASDALVTFDEEVMQCFVLCPAPCAASWLSVVPSMGLGLHAPGVQ